MLWRGIGREAKRTTCQDLLYDDVDSIWITLSNSSLCRTSFKLRKESSKDFYQIDSCSPTYLPQSLMDESSSPFIEVDGVFNFRDIGGYALSENPGLSVRRDCVFRCANPGRITSIGTQAIRDLGIRKIFDLRSSTEIERTADFGPIVNIAGIERVPVPVYVESEYPTHQSVENLEQYVSANRYVGFIPTIVSTYSGYSSCPQDAKSAYVEILEAGGSAFKAIFLHLRDNPSKACLIHCSAGKDRTGVAVALLLAVAGVDDANIIHEYQLTEEGLKAMRPHVIRYLNEKSGPEWTEKQVSKLLGLRCVFERHSSTNPLYQLRFRLCRMDAMAEMLHALRHDYQGVEMYLKSQCGLSDHDITTIKGNLLSVRV